MTSKSAYFESVGRPENYERKKRDLLAPYAADKAYYTIYNDKQILNWGRRNRFPTEAEKVISGTSVLNTGLKFLRTVTLGQGLYACKVTGIDAHGNETLEPLKDERISSFVSGRMVRRYLEKASRDYFKFGTAFVEMLAGDKGFESLNVVNAKYARLVMPDMFGNTELCVSGSWPAAPSGEYEKTTRFLPCLQDFDPDFCADAMKTSGKMKTCVFRIVDSWSNDDNYGEPIWLPAYMLGWVDISHLVPKFLQHAYKNQVTWKWHVQIPYSYWDKKFPEENYMDDPGRRKKDIQDFMDEVERNLCGAENAEKPLFTHYAVNEMNGKIEEEWKITALDNKYKGGENLVTSAAANSEILFALMVNPTVLGATPSGNYTTNAGGSNIREAFLVNIANAWIERQNLLDPVRLLVRQKFGVDVDIRFRNTVLTTLDTGGGTARTLS